MTNASEYAKKVQEKIHQRSNHEPEFLQAIDEFLPTIIPFLENHPEYQEHNILSLIT